jgi:hypothetical protein
MKQTLLGQLSEAMAAMKENEQEPSQLMVDLHAFLSQPDPVQANLTESDAVMADYGQYSRAQMVKAIRRLKLCGEQAALSILNTVDRAMLLCKEDAEAESLAED